MKGVTTIFFFFFLLAGSIQGGKEIDHVILLGSQGPCSGLSKLLFARIGQRDDMSIRLSSFLFAGLPSLLANEV